MTAITDVEALNALAEGDQILVHSSALGPRRWTKTGPDAFKWENAVVGTQFFVGYVNQKLVHVVENGPPQVGDWYSTARYTFFLVKIDGESFVLQPFLRGARRGEPIGYTEGQFDDMTHLDGPPDLVVGNHDSMEWVVAQYQNLLAQLRSQETKPEKAELTEPMVESVTVRLRQGDRVWEITRSDEELEL